MRAMQLDTHANEPISLRLVERDTPQPSADEVLIAVHAAGVTTTEPGWWPSTHHKDGTPRNDAVPAHEFSGVIAAIGDRVRDWTVGQQVYGMNDWFASGALADFCLAHSEAIAGKPASLSHEQAATVPIGALTAWQGLFERAQLQPGERVLVQGGAGAVGMFAVQIAHIHQGAVTATTSASTLDFVRSLGATEVIDYRSPQANEIGTFDVVFDTVGGETRARLPGFLAKGGRLISVAADAEVTTDPVARAAYFIVEPSRTQLSHIATLFDTGLLKTFIRAQVPLSQAAAAYRQHVSGQKGYGKYVVAVRSE